MAATIKRWNRLNHDSESKFLIALMAISLFFPCFCQSPFLFVWPNSLSLALQVIFKPRLVRAEWGSIEAMSGADDEDTAGGRVGGRVRWVRSVRCWLRLK